MSFMFDVLWSDRLIFLLMAVGIASAWYIRRYDHLLLSWRRVGRSNVAMVSLLVLSLFLAVGFLDSLHFRTALPQTNGGEKMYSPEVLSVFDKLAGPLRTHNEKTYSEPFALTLYAKESTTDARGNVVREYPRLLYGGAHLADASQRGALAGAGRCQAAPRHGRRSRMAVPGKPHVARAREHRQRPCRHPGRHEAGAEAVGLSV